MESPPQFPYSPNAYALGLIEPATAPCQCCGKVRGWRYESSPYCTVTVFELCPWCIADGSAARKWDAEFIQGFAEDQPVSPESRDEVLHRTPGYLAWQAETWFAHCGEACCFVGYAGAADVQPFWAEVLPDIVAGGWDPADVAAYLAVDSGMTGYLFECRRCGTHRLHVDCE